MSVCPCISSMPWTFRGQKRALDLLQQESDGCKPHGAGEANLDPLQEQLVLLAEKYLVLLGEAVFLPFIMQASYVGSYKSSITHTAKMGGKTTYNSTPLR